MSFYYPLIIVIQLKTFNTHTYYSIINKTKYLNDRCAVTLLLNVSVGMSGPALTAQSLFTALYPDIDGIG